MVAWGPNAPAAKEIEWRDVDYLRLAGRGEITQTGGASFVGGGFGLDGALEGFAVASILNNLTRTTTTTYETFAHLKAGRCEILLLNTSMSPQLWGVRLSPTFARIELARDAQPAEPTPKPGSRGIAAELAQLAALRDSGALTPDEFAIAKAKVFREGRRRA